MKSEENRKKRRPRFGRALLPPEKIHPPRKGYHSGYSRADEKRDARSVWEDMQDEEEFDEESEEDAEPPEPDL